CKARRQRLDADAGPRADRHQRSGSSTQGLELKPEAEATGKAANRKTSEPNNEPNERSVMTPPNDVLEAPKTDEVSPEVAEQLKAYEAELRKELGLEAEDINHFERPVEHTFLRQSRES